MILRDTILNDTRSIFSNALGCFVVLFSKNSLQHQQVCVPPDVVKVNATG